MVDVAAGKRARVGYAGPPAEQAGEALERERARRRLRWRRERVGRGDLELGGSGGSGSSLWYSLDGFGRFILAIEDGRRVRRTSRVRVLRALVIAARGLPGGQAFTRFFLLRSILATPAEGAKMLVRPSSHRTRKRGGSWARTSSMTPARPD